MPSVWSLQKTRSKQAYKTSRPCHYDPIKGKETVEGWEENNQGTPRVAGLFPVSSLLIGTVSPICQALTIGAFMSKRFFNELVPNVYSILGTLFSEAAL